MNAPFRRRSVSGLLVTALLAGAAAGLVVPGASRLSAAQQPAEKFDFDIPPQVLAAAIPSFMHVTEIKVVFTPELVAGKRTNGVFGSFGVEEGLDVLLDGTGLTYTMTDPKTATLRADSE